MLIELMPNLAIGEILYNQLLVRNKVLEAGVMEVLDEKIGLRR